LALDCELLIRNGLVFDGISAGKQVDIAVANGRVTAIGADLGRCLAGGAGAPPLRNPRNQIQVIDATGMWITPGFVDIHTHYDLEIELAPALSESVRHGVTSVVMGGCSLSVTYGNPKDLADIFSRVETLRPELVEGWLADAAEWKSAAEYIAHLRRLNLGANVAPMLGHSALRVKVMGLERSLQCVATEEEIQRMRELAEDALNAGCVGISVDMVHWHRVHGEFAGRSLPSHHADFAEYAMLAEVCRNRDAVFQVTPDPKNPASILQIIRLCTGIWRAPLRCTILSALDMDVVPWIWRIFSPMLFVCNALLGSNIRFQTLTEPFTIFGQGHVTPFFEEFPCGVALNNTKDREARSKLWQDSEFRRNFVSQWKNEFPRTFHRDLNRMYIVSCPDDSVNGKSIGEAARERGADALTFLMDLLERHDEDFKWKACSANSRPAIRRKLLSHPHILPGFSDAGAHSRNLAFFDSALSLLREAVQSNFMPFERAVALVTSEPAAWFNLRAGVLAVGARADLNVLDPQRLFDPIPQPQDINDAALCGAPRMVKRDPNAAIRQCFIRGIEVVRDGEPTEVLGAKPLGQVLTQLNPTRSAEEALSRFRNRISDNGPQQQLQDYWTVFLLKHQHPGNIAMHCIAFVLMYFIPAFALCANKPLLIVLLPLSQIVGLVGHWLFEPSPIDQRDTIFSWRAFASLHLMFLSVMVGRYGVDAARAKEDWNYAQNFNH
jgi:N-acyl-D-aspartate/D-glutamate deacylase